MDPHSTRSQFNRRTPKAGPLSRSVSEKSLIQDNAKMPSKKRAKTDTLVRRPIATNSRVKQDEMMKRDMYLLFVTNALQEKLNVMSFLCFLKKKIHILYRAILRLSMNSSLNSTYTLAHHLPLFPNQLLASLM